MPNIPAPPPTRFGSDWSKPEAKSPAAAIGAVHSKASAARRPMAPPPTALTGQVAAQPQRVVTSRPVAAPSLVRFKPRMPLGPAASPLTSAHAVQAKWLGLVPAPLLPVHAGRVIQRAAAAPAAAAVAPPKAQQLYGQIVKGMVKLKASEKHVVGYSGPKSGVTRHGGRKPTKDSLLTRAHERVLSRAIAMIEAGQGRLVGGDGNNLFVEVTPKRAHRPDRRFAIKYAPDNKDQKFIIYQVVTASSAAASGHHSDTEDEAASGSASSSGADSKAKDPPPAAAAVVATAAAAPAATAAPTGK